MAADPLNDLRSVFDEELFVREITDVLESFIREWAAKPRPPIHTLLAYIDCNWAQTEVDVDTRERSQAAYERSRRKYAPDWPPFGETVEARNWSGADFTSQRIVSISHASFPEVWAEDSDRLCWRLIHPSAIRAVEQMWDRIRELPHESDGVMALAGYWEDRDCYWPLVSKHPSLVAKVPTLDAESGPDTDSDVTS
ncbi:MAG: hypothetical protein JJU36_06240 [Phycisphaeraceae bacterium]|nr:hypothetical protein [Phycisphaeraceae bacterium]